MIYINEHAIIGIQEVQDKYRTSTGQVSYGQL